MSRTMTDFMYDWQIACENDHCIESAQEEVIDDYAMCDLELMSEIRKYLAAQREAIEKMFPDE